MSVWLEVELLINSDTVMAPTVDIRKYIPIGPLSSAISSIRSKSKVKPLSRPDSTDNHKFMSVVYS